MMDVYHDGTRLPVDEPEPHCPVDIIWQLLWPYIADENSDEDYSAEMAEKLCTEILPKVWDCVLDLASPHSGIVQPEDDEIPY